VVRDNMEGGEDEMRTFGAKLAAKGGHWRTNKVNNVMMISTHGGGTSRILIWFIIFRA
jgi:hypothetical protein